jgi:pimeloyl-ACP methyl ester carboxylesterase
MTGTTSPVLDYVAAGRGPGLVLIHGTGADAAANWETLIDTAGDRYTIVAPNLPGAGGTPAADGPLDLGQLAEQVLATARAAGLERFHLAGHSLGAVIAAAVAAREPSTVRSLLLHAGWMTTGPREAFMFDLWARLLRTDPALLARQLVLTAMAPDLLGSLSGEQLAELAAGFTAMLDERILPQIELNSRIDLRGTAGQIMAPTLVLASADDQVIPPRHQRELADAIASAQYREVPGGHGLPFEDPARFFSIITEFVGSRQAASQTEAQA